YRLRLTRNNRLILTK
ncbi:hemin uptake protein HemP, partial [Acinetobacter baumannii]|nr:hemin uptake protein HemP [Acinetobacter baumannii]